MEINKKAGIKMLRYNTQQKLSEYNSLYDIIIEKDNLLLKIKENIDFSFINPMLKESYCEHFGRPAKEPELMFKLMFLKKLYDLSDESLMLSGYNSPPLGAFLALFLIPRRSAAGKFISKC
jgi:hypothetical protein